MALEFTPQAAEQRDANDTSVSYDLAIANRDPKSLMSIAQQNFGTPIADAAIEHAQQIQQRTDKFNSVVAPIDKQGGAATPEGKLAAVNAWKNTTENPQYGTAIIKYLMGDKAGAAKQITGGDVAERIVYDLNGNQLQKRTNALGETLAVIDMKTGQPVMPEEYASRGVGLSTYGETLASKAAVLSTEARVKSLEENNKINNAWATKMPALGAQYKEIHDNLQLINSVKGELPAELYAKLIQNTTQAQGSAASASQSSSLLDQANNAANSKEGTVISKGITTGLGLPGVFTSNGKGGIVSDKGVTMSMGELAQKQSSKNSSAENTKNITQTKADILKFAALSGMDNKTQTLLLRTLDLSKNIADQTLELTNSVGIPKFLSLPSSFGVEDKYAQGRAQALQGMFSAEAIDEFNKYYKDSIKNYKQGQIPAQNELEANFVKTDAYKRLQDKYADGIHDVLSEAQTQVSKPVTSVPPKVSSPTVGAPPPAKAKKSLNDLFKAAGG